MKLRIATLAVGLLLWAAPALAQGCAMCYSSASGASKDGQRAISRGVLILLIPPLGFMTIGVGAAFQYGRRREQDSENAERENEAGDHDRFSHVYSFRPPPSLIVLWVEAPKTLLLDTEPRNKCCPGYPSAWETAAFAIAK